MPRPPEDCRCHWCGRCYHDHGGLKHKWLTPYPCPGNTSRDQYKTTLWCTLQRDHPGQCKFEEDE